MVQALDIPSAQVSQVHIQALGGDDYIASDRQRVLTPLDVRAGRGNDTVIGGAGTYTIMGEEGDDFLRGGRGNDVLSGGTENERIVGGRGHDVLLGDEGDDILLGRRGDDTLCGGPGDDVLRGDRGNDVADGSPGDDEVHAEIQFPRDHRAVIDDLLQRGEIMPVIDDEICAALVTRYN